MTATRHRRGGPADTESAIPFRLRRDLNVTETTQPKTGVKQFFLKIPGGGDVFQFGEEEYFLCQSLDGTKSFRDIQAEFHARFGLNVSPEQLAEFVDELGQAGMLDGVGPAAANPRPASAPRAAVDVPPTPSMPAAPPPDPVRLPFRWRLFDPSPILRFLGRTLHPLRYFTWLLLPATLLAGLVLFHRPIEYVADLRMTFETFWVLPRLLLSLLVISLVVRIMQATVASSFGAAINSFGFNLYLGFVPRFFIDMRPTWDLDRRGRLWTFATPLLARLALFAIGTFFWATHRSTGTWLPTFALLISVFGFWHFLLTAIPLVPAEGYQWMVEYFEQPRLKERALRLLGMRAKGRPAPDPLTGRDKWALLFFGASVIIVIGTLAITLMTYLAATLEQRFQGAGVVLFLAVFALFLTWLVAARLSVKRLRDSVRAEAFAWRDIEPAAGPHGSASGAVVPFERHLPGRAGYGELTVPRGLPPLARGRSQPGLKVYLVWAGVLGAFGIIAFLPYPYEAGGEFKILPTGRIEIHARVDGELMEVLVDEGDWVEEDQVLAKLSDWDEVRNLSVTSADLQKAQAELRRLEEGAKPEEIELAQKQVESAAARVSFSKSEAQRQATLLKSGSSSARAAEQAQSEYDKNVADLAVAQANLNMVKSGPTEATLLSARAEVERLTKERDYRADELERTRVRAPGAGRVVTPNLKLQRGTYLPVGGLFAELEDNRVAQAEVEVPETDIGEVQIGDLVRLKAWGYSDTVVIGSVVSIAPAAESQEYGRVIRVKTSIPNPDGVLKSDMTGYAKIDGSEMPVWEAYTRLIVRFFRVEFWSWIP